jgi:hypothetical protein
VIDPFPTVETVGYSVSSRNGTEDKTLARYLNRNPSRSCPSAIKMRSRQSCPFVAMENKELRSFYGEKETYKQQDLDPPYKFEIGPSELAITI